MPKGEYQRKATHKQKTVVYLTTCGPLGRGSSVTEAAFLLGVSRDALVQRLCSFKRWNPVAYENYKSIRRVMIRQRRSMQNPGSFSDLPSSYLGHRVKEKF